MINRCGMREMKYASLLTINAETLFSYIQYQLNYVIGLKRASLIENMVTTSRAHSISPIYQSHTELLNLWRARIFIHLSIDSSIKSVKGENFRHNERSTWEAWCARYLPFSPHRPLDIKPIYSVAIKAAEIEVSKLQVYG